MSLFRFDGLSCGYGDSRVIQEISGSIEAGRITALIGPNGGGKSTLLRAFCGLSQTTGELFFDGRPVREIARRDFGRTVGFLPQSISVRAAFSVYEVISLGRLPFHGALEPMTAEDDKIIIESARMAEVEDLLFRRAAELSGGERQRVLFAMTLAQRPKLFLLDEPTSALDPNHTRHLFSLLRRISREGKSVIAAVHDLNSAVAWCGDFIALKEGRITARGPILEMDEDVLERLYGIPFCRFISKDGSTAWHPE